MAVLDADKEGFLRSRVSLIQTMGRAARHVAGQVILYADTMTGSMREAIEEVTRRRNIQLEYNKKHGVTPKSISKPIRSRLVEKVEEIKEEMKVESMTPMDKKKAIVRYTKLLRESSRDLDFESAARFRDLLRSLV